MMTSTASHLVPLVENRPPFDLFRDVPLNVSDIRQEHLDLANRVRTNPFPWRGQFSPELIELLLTNYAQPGCRVLDPFAGVGTTLFEAARRELTCFGTEINPAAATMARTVAFVAKDGVERESLLKKLLRELVKQLPQDLPLFRGPAQQKADPVRIILGLARKHRADPYAANVFANVLIRLLESPAPLAEHALRAFESHREIILRLPRSDQPCNIDLADARHLPMLAHSIDLVVTSPPYINVFNYHQNNRPAMELMGWDLLAVAKAEIGSNRKHRANRFLTVIQYCLDMAAVLAELRRVLARHGRCIIIVGRESSVRGAAFQNGAIVGALASLCGFSLPFRQERKFKNKFGGVIYEDILHLVVDANTSPPSHAAIVTIAVRALESALRGTRDDDIRENIRAAMNTAAKVEPSPPFHTEECLIP